MTHTLYVTNLSETTSPRDLRDLFSQAGQVAAIAVIRDGIAGPDTHMAYVDMQSHDGAEAAVARFHQCQLQGRALHVSARRPDASGGADRNAS